MDFTFWNSTLATVSGVNPVQSPHRMKGKLASSHLPSCKGVEALNTMKEDKEKAYWVGDWWYLLKKASWRERESEREFILEYFCHWLGSIAVTTRQDGFPLLWLALASGQVFAVVPAAPRRTGRLTSILGTKEERVQISCLGHPPPPASNSLELLFRRREKTCNECCLFLHT